MASNLITFNLVQIKLNIKSNHFLLLRYQLLNIWMTFMYLSDSTITALEYLVRNVVLVYHSTY